MPTYRSGALYVVEQASDREPVQRQLRELDRTLFLEKQVSLDGAQVWCVCCTVEGDHPPVTLFEWRDADERPLELSSGIVERARRMYRDVTDLVSSVEKTNAKRVADADKRRDEAYEEIARDMIPRIQGKGRPVLPRGVYLRRSRDKRRARGERI